MKNVAGKILVFLAALAASITVVACGSTKETPNNSNDVQTSVSASSSETPSSSTSEENFESSSDVESDGATSETPDSSTSEESFENDENDSTWTDFH